MNILIIEDEIPAQINLANAIKRTCPELNIVSMQSSVNDSVNYLKQDDLQLDIIFMDVELSDGTCFDIFNKVDIKAKVIITTAYDNYAIKAFKVNSVDYLLKPIEDSELIEAVKRCKSALKNPLDIEILHSLLTKSATSTPASKQNKKRLIVKLGDNIEVINIDNIAYFYSEDKSTFLVTKDGAKHIVDLTLDAAQEETSNFPFFRVSRGCMVSLDSIVNITKHRSHRLKLILKPDFALEVFVSRFRVDDFMTWLEQ